MNKLIIGQLSALRAVTNLLKVEIVRPLFYSFKVYICGQLSKTLNNTLSEFGSNLYLEMLKVVGSFARFYSSKAPTASGSEWSDGGIGSRNTGCNLRLYSLHNNAESV